MHIMRNVRVGGNGYHLLYWRNREALADTRKALAITQDRKLARMNE